MSKSEPTCVKCGDGASGVGWGGAFLEVPPKFTNTTLGLVTPSGFYKGQSNFFIKIDTTGIGVLTNKVGSSTYVVPSSVAVWVVDPKNENKPVGTFK